MFQAKTTQDTRPFFFETWEKHKRGQPLTPLEEQLLDVILTHPEYHEMFENPERSAHRPYFAELGETNPFLHMGLHLAIRDQVSTNRPHGIQKIYDTLAKRMHPLHVEHKLMHCLEDCLWTAQKNNTMPDEATYLKACLNLI